MIRIKHYKPKQIVGRLFGEVLRVIIPFNLLFLFGLLCLIMWPNLLRVFISTFVPEEYYERNQSV